METHESGEGRMRYSAEEFTKYVNDKMQGVHRFFEDGTR